MITILSAGLELNMTGPWILLPVCINKCYRKAIFICLVWEKDILFIILPGTPWPHSIPPNPVPSQRGAKFYTTIPFRIQVFLILLPKLSDFTSCKGMFEKVCAFLPTFTSTSEDLGQVQISKKDVTADIMQFS